MTKEDYVKEMDSIDKESRLLAEKRAKIKEEYIATNAKFVIGEKVIVFTPESHNSMFNKTSPSKQIYAFVSGYKIGYNDEVIPALKKCKKDGTMSSVSQWTWSDDKILKIE